MPEAPLPHDEEARLAALDRYRVLDTPDEPALDRVTRLAARALEAPIALVSLVDRDRQWFKSVLGLEARETPRSQAFCAHAILERTPLVVRDATRDPRFADNPLVTGAPGIRFYAGAPLVTPSGHALGTLCVIDRAPRAPSDEQIETLRDLAEIVVDELELRRCNEALHRSASALSISNTDLTQFATAVSHDLRTPLRHVSAFTAMLQERIGDELDAQSRDWMERIAGASRRMDSMISDLLLLARVDSRGTPPGDCDLNVALAEAVALLQAEIESIGAALSWGDLPTVRAELAQMVQLFVNLIGNALKYRSEQPPVVHIDAEKVYDEWELSVRDNGIGIPAKDRERVFAIFQRLHAASPGEGNGIGLALCHRIVSRHGGRIRVEPAAGGGSVFVFSLPVWPPAAGDERSTCAAPATLPACRTADDEKDDEKEDGAREDAFRVEARRESA